MRHLFCILTACLVLAAPAFANATAVTPVPSHTNSIGMEFLLIPAGTFQMGATAEEMAAVCARSAPKGDGTLCRELREREQIRHEVTLTKAFYYSGNFIMGRRVKNQ